MWSVTIFFVCVAVVVVFAIRKLSRENTEAASSAFPPANAPVSLSADPGDNWHHDFVGKLLHVEDHPAVEESHPDGIIPMSTIVTGVDKFKATYQGPKREEIVAILDEGLAEMKSRYGDQVPASELREFIKAKRQQLFSRLF